MSTTAIEQRRTRQKAAIRSVIEKADGPLSSSQILELAKAEVAGLGIATVYRHIKTLLEEGWLAPVKLPGGATVYECSGKSHHHHFRCDSCHRVFELNGCIPDVNRLAGSKFHVQSHEIVLYGLCADCRPTKVESASRTRL